jgi:signal transduction histidine kinase
MGLPRRLAIVAASMAAGLVLLATEVSLSLSARSRLEDLRQEAITIASVLANYLNRAAPTGDPGDYEDALSDWSGLRLRSTSAVLFRLDSSGNPRFVAATDSLEQRAVTPEDRQAIAQREPVVWHEEGRQPAWHVAQPLGIGRETGLLTLRLSTARLQEWAADERVRSYLLALLAALVLAGSIAWLTGRWVGTPLRALGDAMAGAHAGARLAPSAPELGPHEFRALARRYNELRNALAERERESEARAALLALEERARGFERLALVEEASSSFAHEIGTPLNTINGHFQLLREDLRHLGAEGPAHRVELLLGQVERVAGIVRAWLTRGAWPRPTVHAVDLGQVASRMLEFMEPSLLATGVSAVIVNDTGAPVVAHGDPDLIEQILLNLVKNAIEAMPRGGSLRLGLERSDATVALTVTDTGPGISDEVREQLFHPFATSKGPLGSGLGLTVSRRLARSLGGDLVLEATTSGTRWRLTLPAEAAA